MGMAEKNISQIQFRGFTNLQEKQETFMCLCLRFHCLSLFTLYSLLLLQEALDNDSIPESNICVV